MKRIVQIACLIVALSMPIFSQSAKHKFDVISVKSNPVGGNQFFIDDRPGPRFLATNVPVALLIRRAFRLQDSQIVGGPAWMKSDAFDVEARSEKPLSVDEIGPALQSLLEDRFQLRTHREMRELPVYILAIAKGGSKVKAVDSPYPGGGPMFGYPGYIRVTSRPISSLANYLSPQVGRPVVDRTGLQGAFDIELKFTSDQLATLGQPPDNAAPSVFAALEEQLGLRLESGRSMVEVLIVDAISKPTEN